MIFVGWTKHLENGRLVNSSMCFKIDHKAEGCELRQIEVLHSFGHLWGQDEPTGKTIGMPPLTGLEPST